MRFIFGLLLSAAIFQTATAHAAQVDMFSPQGTVKDVRQVSARFSEPMVPFGDPRLPAPFDIDCAAPGAGRWADARNWVYDFEQDLPAGLRCRYTLKPSLQTLAGKPLSGKTEFGFDTGGPAIRAQMPYEGSSSIDEEQIFLLGLDAPATPASITEHAYCVVNGLAEQIPVKVFEGQAREDVLAPRRQIGYSYYTVLWKDGYESALQVPHDQLRKAEANLAALQCQRPLPSGAKVELVWGAGVATANGAATQKDQVLAYQVREAFAARFECERVNADAGCLPMKPMRLSFNAPVARALASKISLKQKGGKRHDAQLDDEETPFVNAVSFAPYFDENATFSVELPDELIDDAGRALSNAERFPLEVATDEFPPLAKFSGEFGILELKEGGVLPVTLRNVEPVVEGQQLAADAVSGIPGRTRRIVDDQEIARWIERVKKGMEYAGEQTEAGWKTTTGSISVLGDDAEASSISVPKPGGERSFEVVGIPLKEAGFYVVELASPRLGQALLGEDRPRYVATSALVTNLAVHFKWGRESSLAFVTTLDGAQPVANAKIRISNYCDGTEHWQGVTDASGIARIGNTLPEPEAWGSCEYGTSPLMVSARTADDMGFTVTNWNRGISPGDFNLPGAWNRGPFYGHSVLDRALFRAGETVSMKHFVREATAGGFRVPQALPTKLVLSHVGSDDRIELPLSFDANGSAESSWTIPKEAKLGSYELSLMRERPGEDGPVEESVASGSFRVEQYRVPNLRALVQPPAEPLVGATSAPLDLFVSYLSGGAAAGLPVKLRTQVRPKGVSFPDYDDYSFGGEEVSEGVEESGGGGYWAEFDEAQSKPAPARVLPLSLDASGAARTSVDDLPKAPRAQELIAELEYPDSNGELLTVSTRVPLWPSAINLGIATEGWAASSDEMRFKVLALDLKGKPAANQRVSVALFQRKLHSYRKRLIGGFYAYSHSRETTRLDASCSGKTDAQGLLFCKLDPDVSGEILLQARAEDAQQRVALSTATVWVAGDDEWWFEQEPSDRIDVLPEQKQYEVGDTARLQVRMPFRSATALVTVEREGVLESFVTELSGRNPVVELPITDLYSPNAYVSVLAVRGRVSWWRSKLAELARFLHLPVKLDGGAATALIDLSKPAYRLGIASLQIGWKPHRLDVRVKPQQDSYPTRAKAQVDIEVAAASGAKLPAGAEIAVAVVDEGLLELMPNDSWNLLAAMMQKRPAEVLTSTAQMQVVGKRHYGKKAVAAGGGGGHAPARELLDTLLLWQGRVALDAQGHARLEVPLNDSLTSFRIVAIASAGDQLFGTGSASITATQDLQILAGLPPLVREDDRYRGTFTLRNASKRELRITVQGVTKAEPAVDSIDLPPQKLTLAAGAAQEIGWDTLVPVGAQKLDWEVEAQEDGGAASDRLRITQVVQPVHPVRVYQATLTQLDPALELPAERPADAIPGRGGVRITASAKLADALDGVREYMTRYPYICIEQQVSKAVALHDQAQWAALSSALTSYLDGDGLLKYFPVGWLDGDEVLTAYVLAVSDEAGWKIPEATRERMLEGLRGFVAGRFERRSALATQDVAIRKLIALEALSRHGSIEPEQLARLAPDLNLLPTSAVLDTLQIAQRTEKLADRERWLDETRQILRSRLNFQGTRMGFSAEQDDALWWLMISADVNAARVVLALLDDDAWKEDLPRMLNGALQRRLQGHWNTTTANAWGTLAVDKFGAKFEAVPVAGALRATLGEESLSHRWSESPRQTLDFAWPTLAGTLQLTQEGTGKPWAEIQSRAAIPLKAALSSGYRIDRTVTPVEQRVKGQWSRGDVARVKLEIDAQTDATWVVIDDPVPAGSSILGGGLGRDSALLTEDERQEGAAWPAFEERRQDAYRAYYGFVPKGRFTLEYTVRYNASGQFELPTTRVEAVYAPEMFGELPNATVEVAAP